MRTWLRLLTLWLSALALPVQGLAAAVMVHCGPSHGRMHAQMAQAGNVHGPHAQGHGHAQAADAQPAHAQSAHAQSAHAPTAHAPTAAAAHAAPAPTAEAADLAPYTCGACASCCTGLALLSAVPQVPEPAPVAPAFVVQVPAIADVARPGPDRPPRLSLA